MEKNMHLYLSMYLIVNNVIRFEVTVTKMTF